jgi:recombination protein RecR
MPNKMKNSNSENEIDSLIALLAKLPGFGKRSARRAVLHLVNKRESLMRPISQSISNVYKKARKCDECGNITTDLKCLICNDINRDKTKLCVVSDVSDLWAMERANTFKGRFYVLGGLLSALDGIDPDFLRIPFLIERIKNEQITEVILALSATINGQTTAHYIADQISKLGVKTTSLAHGVPIGGELDYLDEGTIDIAFKARKIF